MLRIVSYIHNDSSSLGKYGVMVKFQTKTDFAIRSHEFTNFVNDVTRMACGLKIESKEELINSEEYVLFVKDIEKLIKEKVEIIDYVFMSSL